MNNDVEKRPIERAAGLDPGFGKDGISYYSFSHASSTEAAALFVDDDKKLLLGLTVGTALSLEPPRHYALMQMRDNGARDETFGRDGVVGLLMYSDTGGSSTKQIWRVQDRKILTYGLVVAPAGSLGLPAFSRFLETGEPDESFGEKGVRIVLTHEPGYGGAFYEDSAATIVSDGKVILAGTLFNGFDVYKSVLARLNNDGSADASFAGQGFVLGRMKESYIDVLPSEGGRFLVAGWSADRRIHIPFVRCFGANGEPDRDYADEGTFKFYREGWHCQIGKILPRLGGGVYCLGRGYALDYSAYETVMFALTADGRLDSSFHGEAHQDLDWIDGAVDSRGRLSLVCGAPRGTRIQLRRYLPDGKLDSALGDGTGWVETELPAPGRPLRLTLQGDNLTLVTFRMITGQTGVIRFAG